MRIARTTLMAVVLSVACGKGFGGAPVASVQLQTTNTSPKVGDVSHVGATPVDPQGIPIPA